MLRDRLERAERRLGEWLRQGLTPRRLAFTLALGLAVGCCPILGVTTVVCVGLAFALRLNLPALEAANYAALPVQLAMIVPFARMGTRLLPMARPGAAPTAGLLRHMSWRAAGQVGWLATGAVLAWALAASVAVPLLTLALTPVIRWIETGSGRRAPREGRRGPPIRDES